jgi:hypothetical protein
MRSDERPNCMRLNLAICSLSFSIPSALYCTESSATFNSLWQASVQIPIHRGHLLRFDRGQATDLMAATIPI